MMAKYNGTQSTTSNVIQIIVETLGVEPELVERYDRLLPETRTQPMWRIHQEDLCQALGLGPGLAPQWA